MPEPSKDAGQPQVLFKLVMFSLLMAIVPVATYFGTLQLVWEGSPTYAAISAVIAANLVLVGYVVVAFREDAGQQQEVPAVPARSEKATKLPPKKIL